MQAGSIWNAICINQPGMPVGRQAVNHRTVTHIVKHETRFRPVIELPYRMDDANRQQTGQTEKQVQGFTGIPIVP